MAQGMEYLLMTDHVSRTACILFSPVPIFVKHSFMYVECFETVLWCQYLRNLHGLGLCGVLM